MSLQVLHLEIQLEIFDLVCGAIDVAWLLDARGAKTRNDNARNVKLMFPMLQNCQHILHSPIGDYSRNTVFRYKVRDRFEMLESMDIAVESVNSGVSEYHRTECQLFSQNRQFRLTVGAIEIVLPGIDKSDFEVKSITERMSQISKESRRLKTLTCLIPANPWSKSHWDIVKQQFKELSDIFNVNRQHGLTGTNGYNWTVPAFKLVCLNGPSFEVKFINGRARVSTV